MAAVKILFMRLQHAFCFDKRQNLGLTCIGFKIRHDIRFEASGSGSHAGSVLLHDFSVSANIGRQISFIDYKQIAFINASPSLRVIFSPAATSNT